MAAVKAAAGVAGSGLMWLEEARGSLKKLEDG